MRKAILWLRISFWLGALIDALAAIQMLFPKIFASTNQLANFNPPDEYRYAMGMAASLMLGWSLLLIWANRKPMERKGILILTIIPVIGGLVVNEISAVAMQFISIRTVLPVWILQAILIALFAFSYLNARVMESKGPTKLHA